MLKVNPLIIKLLFLQFFTQMFFYENAFSQTGFSKIDSVEVKIDGNTVKFPWAGGLNFCQFSTIDLNLDGIKDLFVFDKTGNRITTLINKGTPNSVDYKFAPEYIPDFPELVNWVLLVDYNCDGKEDIFSSATGGIAIYKNISDASGLKFILEEDLLLSNYNPSMINLYVSATDIPAITDIDNDGDIDILTFSILGSFVEFHKNYSMELYGHCDSLSFVLETSCWGNFEENNVSNQVSLDISCKGKSFEVSNGGGSRHAGSTLLALDMNGDGDKELVIGDVSSTQLLLLTNGGSKDDAYIIAQDPDFPSNTLAASIFTFPAAFFLDVDNDNIKDLLVSPSAPNASENFNSIYFYKNSQTNEAPVFNFIKNNFLQDDMIDVGEGAYPVLFDFNRDGKFDLFIGNYGYFDNISGVPKSSIAYFKNIGTKEFPKFDLITRDFGSLESQGFLNIYPSFGDMDGDGDDDLIIGEQDGGIHFFENTNGSLSNPVFSLTGPNYFGLDVGQASAPILIDVNRDNKLDLVIGERNGTLNYVENTGSTTNPVFDTLIEFWGEVDVRKQGFTVGYSIPFMFESNGKFVLVVGSENGGLYVYDNIENNIGGIFNKVSSSWGNIFQGIRTSASVADLNKDGIPDMVVGNYAGGISLYYGNNIISTHDAFKGIRFEIFPNPAADYLLVEINSPAGIENTITIWNMLGEILLKKNNAQLTEKIFLEGIPSGIYLIEVKNPRGSSVHKFIKF